MHILHRYFYVSSSFLLGNILCSNFLTFVTRKKQSKKKLQVATIALQVNNKLIYSIDYNASYFCVYLEKEN